jgi:hypothetical protein
VPRALGSCRAALTASAGWMVRLSRDATFVRGGDSYGGIRRFRFVYGGGMRDHLVGVVHRVFF